MRPWICAFVMQTFCNSSVNVLMYLLPQPQCISDDLRKFTNCIDIYGSQCDFPSIRNDTLNSMSQCLDSLFRIKYFSKDQWNEKSGFHHGQ